MKHQKKITILLFICASGFLISLGCIAYILQTDGQMVFPKSATGSFFQNPAIVSDGKETKITWILPEKCDDNSYEIREDEYVQNAGMLWGGGDASCLQTEAGFECRSELHPEMKGDRRHWVVQAYGYGCVNASAYISTPIKEIF